ncbi:unnamed protein product [Acidithrix sp. C25]|nr:unnamed protein product [Acidithrix sp. C25]
MILSMRGQILLIEDNDTKTKTIAQEYDHLAPDWKLDERTRKLGLWQIEQARRLLISQSNNESKSGFKERCARVR